MILFALLFNAVLFAVSVGFAWWQPSGITVGAAAMCFCNFLIVLVQGR